jgi:hypothetical protein
MKSREGEWGRGFPMMLGGVQRGDFSFESEAGFGVRHVHP